MHRCRLRSTVVPIALTAALVGVSACGSDEEPASTPGSDGDGSLEALLADLDDDGPGCVLGVLDDGDVDVAVRGMADLDEAVPLEASTVFDIGSVSKQFTAGVIALLVLDGEIDLGDDGAVLAGLEPYSPMVTVSDLVHMSSGLPDYIGLLDAEVEEVTTMDDALAVLGDLDVGPEFTPGTRFEYSNSNYVLLSAIVEQVSGESLATFSDERIFDPLGMDSAVVREDQGTLLPDQAQGYADDDDGDWRPVGSSWRQTGDGAVHTSVPDLLRWSAMFVDGDTDIGDPGEAGLGSTDWLELMVSAGPVRDEDGSEYGFGIGVEDDGEVLAHSGSWIGYSSALVVIPGADVAAAISCNIDGFDAEGLAREAAALRAEL